MSASFRHAAASVVLLTLLVGCGNVSSLRIPGVYRTTIQQGNVITQQMVDRLEPGMTRSQVLFVLGEPILGNTFRDERWDYVYTIQVGAEERSEQQLVVWFDDDRLERFEGDLAPSNVAEAREEALERATEAVTDEPL